MRAMKKKDNLFMTEVKHAESMIERNKRKRWYKFAYILLAF